MRTAVILPGIWNLIVFLIYGLDKRKAVKHAWRIPESTLILIAAAGGAPGAFLGMHVFHHKTRKPLFSIGVPALLVLQGIVLYLYLK